VAQVRLLVRCSCVAGLTLLRAGAAPEGAAPIEPRAAHAASAALLDASVAAVEWGAARGAAPLVADALRVVALPGAEASDADEAIEVPHPRPAPRAPRPAGCTLPARCPERRWPGGGGAAAPRLARACRLTRCGHASQAASDRQRALVAESPDAAAALLRALAALPPRAAGADPAAEAPAEAPAGAAPAAAAPELAAQLLRLTRPLGPASGAAPQGSAPGWRWESRLLHARAARARGAPASAPAGGARVAAALAAMLARTGLDPDAVDAAVDGQPPPLRCTATTAAPMLRVRGGTRRAHLVRGEGRDVSS
jgi:hypothetical protein